MKFRPLHDRIVIRRLEGEEKTKAGIIIPDTAQEKPQEGEVVAVVLARATKPVNSSPSISRRAIACCSANGRAQK
jgi:co-chaperonin GroES (HSP10)